MATVRVPLINELLALSLQSAEGTQATPTAADMFPFLSVDVNPKYEHVPRTDKGLGRSQFGFVPQGKQAAEWKASAYIQLPVATTPPPAMLGENLIVGALGATAVSYSDTVAASPAPTTTTFTVSSAASLKVGDVVAVNVDGSTTWEVRPISAIATNALTFSIPFSVAPSTGAAVTARIYRLSSSPTNFFTVANWLRDDTLASSSYSIVAVDAVIDQLEIELSQAVATLMASGPAAKAVESGVPAIPTLPTDWVTGYSPFTPNLQGGEVYIDTTLYKFYEFKATIKNNAKQLPAPFGSIYADGTVLGMRDIDIDVLMDGNSDNTTLLTDSETVANHSLFAHMGNTQGQFFCINAPLLQLIRNDYKKDQETLRLDFTGSKAFASAADNEIVIAIA